ncbi:methylation-associated defense system protein kinase MAD6 [Actinomadura verrucosospora]|uniref:non-specific serine/threonine protein kinase n=1 Tax=Actinomadura verrucosospora TaxID=46165 RepID=A0A7D3W3L8_ACTVE|nr:serine/threonine protein kinase [Actinomadura verrucosospora]QKG25572.1 serine/threonine protein kinase [Actinomadura verrucosospora]
MARIIGGGPPVNDAERRTIAHLRDHGPDEWLVLHNIELPIRGAKYEIDVVVITEHSVVLIDVKGTHGRIQVAGGRWFPERRGSFGSPVAKLAGLAKAFKGRLTELKPELSRVYFDPLVVLTSDDAVLIDPNVGTDADANDVTTLGQLVPTLKDVSRVRSGMLRDIRRYGTAIVEALRGVVEYPTGPRRFGNWVVEEELGGTEEVTEYRAKNATVAGSETVLLRVYRADPFQPEIVRAAERIAIANAYEVLGRMGRSQYIVGQREFFAVEDESQFVLVLDDVHGEALHVHLTNPRQPLSADAKVRVFGDILRGLAHAHRNRVIHRALSPAAVLVTGGGRAMLTGFDYARPEDPRNHTVINRLAEALDPVYVAPECQDRPQEMSPASDVYAAGVIGFHLLTGETPFVSSADQFEKGSVLPAHALEGAGVSDAVAGLLQKLCSLAPSARPSASKALRELLRIAGNDGDGEGGGSSGGGTGSSGERGPDYRNLPEGYQLTRKYTVRRKLGSGTYGHVYQVYDNLAAEDRAVKIVIQDRESLAERIRQEYQILQRLDPHDNVVKADSADYLPDGTPYLAFEYLDGSDVKDLIDERRLGPADAVKFAVDIARGLAFLHDNNVFHCDIKPRNLMLTDKGGKILDFNVSVTGDSSMSRAGGTTRYAPPDTRNAGRTSAAELIDRDLYGLGLTFYQVVTGNWPFRMKQPILGEDPLHPSEYGMSDLSDAFVSVMLKAVAPQRSSRFTSAAELLSDLEAIGNDVHRRPVEPEPAPAPRPARDGANPFVDHLKTLYSQSTSSNAGTRGHDSFDLYVPTELDYKLLPAVLGGEYGLVVITGNAGDGKTAFLEQLVHKAEEQGADPGAPRANGADVRLKNGTWLRTNHDGSQDEGDKANDEVLLDFFEPFAGADPAGADGEIRLIAINEGRLIDFLSTHAGRFGGLKQAVEGGLSGAGAQGRVAVVNLNRRSVVADVERDSVSESIFDRMLRRMTHERFWEACDSCELAKRCYAPHNARTFAHPSAGPQVTRRLKRLYTLTHLRGRLHVTLRDLRSGLAYMLTSGRSCAEIQELYGAAGAGSSSGEENARTVLDGFYFNSWAGAPGTEDRLLAQLRDVDVAAVPEPGLDRRLDYTGPDAGQAVMTVDRRGDYDMRLLQRIFGRLPRGAASPAQAESHGRYLASARRRFYFECVDEQRSRRLLPYRSADRFLGLLENTDRIPGHLGEVIEAINRGEGLPDPRRLGDHLAMQVRQVPGGTIRSYRLFEAASFDLAAQPFTPSPYLEEQPAGLVLSHRASSGQTTRLALRLDLYELLHRLRAGYLPGIAEAQGLYLALTIFKNELSAAPYQEVLVTTGGTDLHRIRREPDARLTMRELTMRGVDADENAGGER